MHMGPDSLIIAARVALDDDLRADQAEDLADAVDRKLAERIPLQLNVFIDPTQTNQDRPGPAEREEPPAPAPSSTRAAAPRT
jgi:divalent metal cation (Fe/Co/Zn/Cd) transporter